MKTNNLMLSTIRVQGSAMLVLALIPLANVSAWDGLATGTITSPTGSAGQQASFTAMQQICINSGGAASFACSLTAPVGVGVFPAPTPGNSLQFQQISPQAGMQAESIAITSPYRFIRSITQHLQKRKESGKLPSSSGDGFTSDGFGFIGPFGVSFSGGGGFGDRDTSVGQTGFRIDTRQANLIIDYPFAQDIVGGFSFGYINSERSLALASGSLDSDSYRFAPFLSYTPNHNSYFTLMGGYASVDFESIRSVSPFTNSNTLGEQKTISLSNATAKYNADQFFASLGAGYTHDMGVWSLRGYGRGDYNYTHVSGFQEQGAFVRSNIVNDPNLDTNSYAAQVNGQNIVSVTSTLGAELSYAFSTPSIDVAFIPRLHAEWVHEFENSGRQIQSAFNQVKDGGGNINPIVVNPISVAGPERDWANVGFRLQMEFPNAIVGFLSYDTLFIKNASNQTVSGGVRINF